jgi:hypothetical protein
VRRVTGKADTCIEEDASELDQFRRDSRRNLFRSIAIFCRDNGPTDGYYMEFGCHTARTMRLAWDVCHHEHNWTYVGFDSFERSAGNPGDRQDADLAERLMCNQRTGIFAITRTWFFRTLSRPARSNPSSTSAPGRTAGKCEPRQPASLSLEPFPGGRQLSRASSSGADARYLEFEQSIGTMPPGRAMWD